MPRLALIACSDDFLLEDSLRRAVAEACAALGGVEPELLGDEATAERVAVELRSPSLFAAARVLVVSEARRWLSAPAPAEAPVAVADDPAPLVELLSAGLPEGVALVMGAWCGRCPRGELVAAVEERGRFEWIPLPEPPKPWQKVLLSAEQRAVLVGLLRRSTPGVRFAADAERLLLERLGFAPRLLVQEAAKLVAAAGPGGVVSEELVRELAFPRERSLEVVREAVLNRELAVLLDLVSAAAAGVPVRSWQGERLDPARLAAALVGQVFGLLHQLLWLRRLAVAEGIEEELEPARTGDGRRYWPRFKSQLAPRILDRLEREPSPLASRGKLPSPGGLGQLFAGAGRYQEQELLAALAEGGEVEAQLRGPLPLEAVTSWLVRAISPGGAARVAGPDG